MHTRETPVAPPHRGRARPPRSLRHWPSSTPSRSAGASVGPQGSLLYGDGPDLSRPRPRLSGPRSARGSRTTCPAGWFDPGLHPEPRRTRRVAAHVEPQARRRRLVVRDVAEGVRGPGAHDDGGRRAGRRVQPRGRADAGRLLRRHAWSGRRSCSGDPKRRRPSSSRKILPRRGRLVPRVQRTRFGQ